MAQPGTVYLCNYSSNTPGGPVRSWNPNNGALPAGGRLTPNQALWTPGGPGTPMLNGNNSTTLGDQIQAKVTFGTANNAALPIGNVTAVFTFTPANDALGNQAGASPFLSGGTFVCSQTCQGQLQQGANSNQAVYLFGPTPVYNGGLPGAYELTIVITDSSTPKVQWSTDPEFDTSS